MNFCKKHGITYKQFIALKRASRYYFGGRFPLAVKLYIKE